MSAISVPGITERLNLSLARQTIRLTSVSSPLTLSDIHSPLRIRYLVDRVCDGRVDARSTSVPG